MCDTVNLEEAFLPIYPSRLASLPYWEKSRRAGANSWGTVEFAAGIMSS